jgi:hypothetical protein
MNEQPTWDETTDLDFRTADGIEVTLLWAKAIGRVWVAVRNDHSGEEFEIEVRDTDSPLHVFRHPYAYAAARTPELLAAA